MDYLGYAGKILYVDLETSEIREEPLPLDLAKDFIGGGGLNHRLAYDLIKPGIDALSPDNVIIIGAGPLVGTIVPASRVMGITKEPFGGVIGPCGGGMRLGFMMKLSGYDHVVITGKAKRPVYLKIIGDYIEICDASDLWGKDLVMTTEELWDRYAGCSVLAISQAGENRVRFALAKIDTTSTFGRGGLGAVMGSKNLKAVVVRGNGPIKLARPERVKPIVDSIVDACKMWPQHEFWARYASTGNWANAIGQFLYRKNYREAISPEEATELYGPQIYDKVSKAKLGCSPCLYSCKDVLEIKEGENKGLVTPVSAYAGAGLAALKLGIKDYHQGLKLTSELDRYGLDYFAFGGLLDFLLHLHELGIISKEDVGGLPLEPTFTSYMTWADKIVFREGFGDVVADGWYALIDKIGKGCEEYAHIQKGKDYIYEPRLSGLGSMEFEQIVCPRGPTSSTAVSPTYTVGLSHERLRRRMGIVGYPERSHWSHPFGATTAECGPAQSIY